MNYSFAPILPPLIGGAGILLFLTVYTIKNMRKSPAVPFLLVLLAFLIWTCGYALEISAQTLQLKLMWANIQFIGIGAAPILWFITVLKITGHQRSPKLLLSLVSIIPLTTIAIAFSDTGHHFFRNAPQLAEVRGILLTEANYGAWHNWMFLPYQYLLYGASLLILIYACGTAKKPYRQQYISLIVAAAIPFVGSALYILGIPPFVNLNPTPLLFGIASLVFAKAIFSYRILDITPVARETVVENMHDAMLVFDNELRLTDFNQAAASLFPAIRAESIGFPASELFDEHSPLLRQLEPGGDKGEKQEGSIAHGEGEIDFSLLNDNTGMHHHYRSSLSPITCPRGKKLGKVLLLSDITTQVDLLHRMEWLATTDELTELANRRSFFQRATMEIERAHRYERPISFILLDIDHFKHVNDNYGHAAGDKVLMEISRRIRSSIRDTDIAGRYGGEEFAVCLPETPQETAEMLAERLRSIIAGKPVCLDELELTITASFGIIGRNKIDEETLEELFSKADKALYLAKEKGRNLCIPFSY